MGLDAAQLARDVEAGLLGAADASYVEGTVAARHPGKPVLGVRIPVLRETVRAQLRARGLIRTGRRSRAEAQNHQQSQQQDLPASSAVLLAAADLLWRGRFHEGELAASMLLRVAGAKDPIVVPVDLLGAWADLLDNWLSVDELGGVIGAFLAAARDDRLIAAPSNTDLDELQFLARSPSPWARRLYLVGLIAPMRLGLPVREVPCLSDVLTDSRKPVRTASVWLIREVLKRQPGSVAQWRQVLPGDAPATLTRLLTRPAPSRP